MISLGLYNQLDEISHGSNILRYIHSFLRQHKSIILFKKIFFLQEDQFIGFLHSE